MTRLIRATTPFGNDVTFHHLEGVEELGRLFKFEVDLGSAEDNLDFDKVIGKDVTIEIDTETGVRYLHGIVSRFGHRGTLENETVYRATLRPWLWLLTRKADCRIFQNKSAVDIIKEVFREHNGDFKESLSGSFAKREYCVQYRETDFNFVSRLMEEEGIYYYFTHENGKHTLVLSNDYSSHSKFSGFEKIPYRVWVDGQPRRDMDHIDGWALSESLQPGAYVMNGFDFEKPKSNLEVKAQGSDKLADKKLEIYEYPGPHIEAKAGENLARIRVEEFYAMQEFAEGEGNARGIAPGYLFELEDYPRKDQNGEYLIVRAEYDMWMDTGQNDDGMVLRTKFKCVDSKRPYRSECTTPRPIVKGPQTAMVVGKSSEEIWTDKHGRVKLQFHWDRLGKNDENSSCWVRVAQLWAGAKWGGIHIPRIGQEVIVEFLEGNPDRPIVTGRVYNGDNQPPYTLPANQTQSGIMTRSTPKGTAKTFNELRFEDKKDKEQIYLQAQKDLEIYVINDETHNVDNDLKQTVKNDVVIMVENNRTETVKKEETITVEGGRTETVKKDEKITIEGARTESVAKDEKISIDGARTTTVGKDEKLTISGGQTTSVSKDNKLTVSGAHTVSATKDCKISSSTGGVTISATKDMKASGMKVDISGNTELKLSCGAASITLKASGQIDIKGTMVTVDGSAMNTIKSSGILTVQGSMVTAK